MHRLQTVTNSRGYTELPLIPSPPSTPLAGPRKIFRFPAQMNMQLEWGDAGLPFIGNPWFLTHSLKCPFFMCIWFIFSCNFGIWCWAWHRQLRQLERKDGYKVGKSEDELEPVSVSHWLSKIETLREAGAICYGAKHMSDPGVELKEEI